MMWFCNFSVLLLLHTLSSIGWTLWLPENSSKSSLNNLFLQGRHDTREDLPLSVYQLSKPGSKEDQLQQVARCFVVDENASNSAAAALNKSNSLDQPPLHQIAAIELRELIDKQGAPDLIDDNQCRTEIAMTTDDQGELKASSMCSWYWQENVDVHRIPQLLPEVKCRCKHALTSQGEVAYNCDEVKSEVVVLKLDKACQNGGYRERFETISLACVAKQLENFD